MRFLRIATVVALPIGLCLSQPNKQNLPRDEQQTPLGHQQTATSSNDNPLDDSFSRKVEWALEHYHIPGLAISVVQNGSEFAKGYGLSNLETSTPMTPSTLLYGGSTTKAHIAAAVSLLVANNTHYPHVQWDTPVHQLLPGFSLSDPFVTTQVTLADMLSHRTGLPRHDLVMAQNISASEIVRKMRDLPLTKPIRSEFQYCNLMFITAGVLIETLTGQPLEVFMRENLWGVLGMEGTFFDPATARAHGFGDSDIAQGYWFDNTTKEILATGDKYTPSMTGAGNILTSVTDHAKWMNTLLTRPDNSPISPSSYETLFSAQTIASRHPTQPFSSPMLYGLGWMIQSYRGQSVISHDGAQDGFGATVYLLPEKRFGVSILGNNMLGTNAAMPGLVFELVDRVLDVPESERFNWVKMIDSQLATAGKLKNDTLSSLYPHLPTGGTDSLLPHPLNLSAYSGLYIHPSYPALNISTTCPPMPAHKIPPAWTWTGTRLCGSFVDAVLLTSDMDSVFDFLHVTGTYWVAVMEFEGMSDVARVEFGIGAEGAVGEVGVEFEVTMREKKGKIWFERDS